jgi:hypothetical protein
MIKLGKVSEQTMRPVKIAGDEGNGQHLPV